MSHHLCHEVFLEITFDVGVYVAFSYSSVYVLTTSTLSMSQAVLHSEYAKLHACYGNCTSEKEITWQPRRTNIFVVSSKVVQVQ